METNTEKRKSERLPIETKIIHENNITGLFDSSKMYNYSKEGLYFESDLFLKTGEEIFIGIEDSPYTPKPGEYEIYHSKIQWRRELQDSQYKYGYGGQYIGPGKPMVDNGDQAEVKLPDQPTKSDKDTRKFPRIPIKKIINYFTNNKVSTGIVRNISRSGAFIETTQAFTVGQKLTLALPFLQRDKNAMVKGEVMWANNKGIGIKFKKAKTA